MMNNPMNSQPQDHRRHLDGCQGLVNSMYGEADGECIDGNCVETQMRLIEQHVKECPRCLELLSAEQKVQDLLRQRCGQQAPQELKTKIVRQLRVTYTEVRRG